MNPRRPSPQGGAVLLLLLAVLSLGAATLLLSALGGGRPEARRELRTQNRLAQAREALVGFAIQHGRLPRPAASPLDGRERAQPCLDEAGCTGFLPWVALGVDGVDAWAKLLRYSVTPAFTRQPIERDRALATKTVLHRDAGGRLFFLAGGARCTLQEQCSPAVLLSNGKNNLGVSVLGVAQANNNTGNRDEQLNDSALSGFVARAASDDPAVPGGSYDDMVSALPLTLLYRRMDAAGQLH
ncbi:hypothetical protein [Rugamonas sp. DEMB1]|uniref:hypothetical protein n=1 Tax=Rugamonas sp. DEMB1 TaxID=3039386 RepID=UPI00244C0CF9|nr:hypothetical protein [Rugamonas sp. DEMB1]WGG52667.1 hypothetical protein QC826_11265 [Rugamonas sp. DEMB1]